MISSPRFVVRKIHGYNNVNGINETISYWVADTAYNFKEVATFYSGRYGTSDYNRRTKAQILCDELNKIDSDESLLH